MKILYLFLIPCSLFAQDKFKVEYEKRSFLKLTGNNPEYRLMEEEFSRPTYIQLLGDQNKCSLKQIDRVNNAQGAATQMSVIGAEKDLESYFDFAKNEMMVSKDVDGKVFLITSKINPSEWKIAREMKKVKGFNAKRAIFEKDGFAYEVWYSTDIKSKCGPDNAYGFPGLVLEAKMTHIEHPDNYTQYKLDQLTVDNTIKYSAPTKGKPVTAEEFKKFRDEYDKRLKEMYGTIEIDNQ